jgi:5'-3' exonuclease
MGIKHLNKYLTMNCTRESIQRIALHELRGRTVVIDCFQFLYKFLADNRMEEHMDQMINMLIDRQIVPIFVFDGKPPPEKKAVLEQRRAKKHDAKVRYDELMASVTSMPTPELANELACLKKKFIRIDYEHIQCAKKIMQQYDITYVDAPGEADAVCVEMVQSQRAWACLSDDMDMFAYGCDRVLRELSLVSGKVTLYRTQSILIDLRVSMQEFREILVISGTDYHDGTTDQAKYHNLYETMKWFQSYRREQGSVAFSQSNSHRHPTRYYYDPDSAWSGYRAKYERRQYMNHTISERYDGSKHNDGTCNNRSDGTCNNRSDGTCNNHRDGKFYPWLMKHTKYIHDYEALMKIYNMFVI